LLGAGSGCRTAGVGDLSRRDTLAPRVSWKAEDLLADHNENARKVRSLEAFPSVTVNRKIGVGLSGKLALERPRNFNMTLASTMAGDVANIGSNDQEFWFWVKDSDPKAVFFCNYEDSSKNPLGSSLQPDWIVESLGLQAFDAETMAGAQVKPGTDPGTMVVTQRPRNASGPSFLKETVVAESTRRVIEQRIFTPDKKTLLARATVSDHQRVELPSPEGEPPSNVDLPRKLRLEWTQEKLILDVVLNKVKVNPVFAETRRAALFAKPAYEGYAEVNLAEREGLAIFEQQAPGPRTTIRQSIPSPPPRVRLSEPSPLGSRGPERAPARIEQSDVALNVPALEVGPIEAVIGPRIPTVSEPSRAYIQANPGWKSRFGESRER
jgi:hypothetical protein